MTDPTRDLFRPHERLRAVIDAGLEGRIGALRRFNGDRATARLDVGCYAIFAGDPSTPAAGELARTVAAPRELVFPDSGWRGLLEGTLVLRVTPRAFRSYVGDELDVEELDAIVGGLDSDLTVERIDREAAEQLDEELQPHALQVYGTTEAFVEGGVGFGVFDGGRLVSASTTYALSAELAEVSISTRPEYRRRGLGAVASARLLLHCLEHGVEPHWTASNPVSQHLALSLGLRPIGDGEVLDLLKG